MGLYWPLKPLVFAYYKHKWGVCTLAQGYPYFLLLADDLIALQVYYFQGWGVQFLDTAVAQVVGQETAVFLAGR